MICRANQLTGFYMMGTLAVKGLISGTYFDSSVLVDDKQTELDVYNLIRANHPNNTKTGGVCIYYKESLGIKVLNIPFINVYYAKF